MPILRRAALAATPLALLLALAACGSDSASTASSTPTSSTTTTTVVLAPTTVLPASTAVGQPVPIGQPTTTVAGQSTPGPGETTPASTNPGDTGAATTTAAAAGGTAGSPTTTTAPPAGGATSTSPAAGPTTTLELVNAATAFCQFEAEVEEKTGAANDDTEFLAALTALEPRMDQWVADAPNNEQRAAATILHQATRSAISSKSVDPFDGDDVTKATLTVQLFCGAVG